MTVEQKVEQVREEKGIKTRKMTWRERFGFIPVMWIFLIGVTTGASWTIARANYSQVFTLEPRSITIINPVRAAESTQTLKIEASEVEVPDGVEAIADKIYLLESTNGAKDAKCERIGGHNGYGFGQGDGRNFCLSSDNEVRELVKSWIRDKQAQGMTENELLCFYNTGKVLETCAYVQGIE